MSFAEQRDLAEKLRLHILSFPQMPVKGGAFYLDAVFSGIGKSMSLQINPGQTLEQYLDGSRVMRQPFSIYYSSSATEMNENKSAMMGTLNSIGIWMEKEALPDLGPGIKPLKMEQEVSASIYQQDNATVGYMAQYILEYERN